MDAVPDMDRLMFHVKHALHAEADKAAWVRAALSQHSRDSVSGVR